MKHIELTQGKKAAICDCHYDLVKDYKWCFDTNGYAKRSGYSAQDPTKVILMHRVIANALPGQEVDHIDVDGLNNQCSNLRVASRAENCHNIGAPKDNKSGYKGVSWNKNAGKYMAYITIHGNRKYLGLHTTAEAASKKYMEVAVEHFGEFARAK